MSTKYCTLELSAMSWNQKRAILSQDLIRRLLNTSENVEPSVRDGIALEMAKILKRSGYKKSQVQDIMGCGLWGYRRKWGSGQERHRRVSTTAGASKVGN